jgi:hypothetical protein
MVGREIIRCGIGQKKSCARFRIEGDVDFELGWSDAPFDIDALVEVEEPDRELVHKLVAIRAQFSADVLMNRRLAAKPTQFDISEGLAQLTLRRRRRR